MFMILFQIIEVLGLCISDELNSKYGFKNQIPEEERPVVFVGPFEHHSNEISWRETIADVIEIEEDKNGTLSIAHLEEQLQKYQNRPLKIGLFSQYVTKFTALTSLTPCTLLMGVLQAVFRLVPT